MNLDENVINTFEEDCWASSNCLEEKTVNNAIDISDVFKKQYDFTVDISRSQLDRALQAEAKKEKKCVVESADFIIDNSNIWNSVSSNLSAPIWIMVDKKTQGNRTIKSFNTRMVNSGKLGTNNARSHLIDKFDSITNSELTKFKSVEDTSMHNNIPISRNVPSILRSPKIVSQSNKSSPIPFEIEDNSFSTNNVFENNISEREENRNTKTSHRKRKQIHNPLVIQEDSMTMTIDTKYNYCDKSMKKIKFESRRAEKFVKNYQKETNCENKSLLYKKIGNKISVPPTSVEETMVQNSSITTNGNTFTNKEIKDQMNDLNLSSEFDEFYKEQFHEDYTDHLDILADVMKEYQDIKDCNDHQCYNTNSNYIANSNGTEFSNLQYKEFPDYGRELNEYAWDNIDIIEKNYLSEYEDCFNHNNNFLAYSKDLESANVTSSDCNLGKASIQNLYNKNCSSSFLSDLSDDEFSLKTLSYNDLQNSFNKDEARHLDTLLLEEKKCEVNLENHLNNELNSSKINFQFINDIKNTTPISLSNGLEHTTTIRQGESEQESDQCDVLLNTDLSANISSEDYPENTVIDVTNLLEEKHLLIQKNIEKEPEILYNYAVQLNYKKISDKHVPHMESNESTETDESPETDEDVKKIKMPKRVIETLQCLLCTLTFTSKRTLALHLAGAHGGMYVILCERCGRLFNKKCLFNRHFIHCGCVTLPFGCQKCNKTYRHKSSLLHHLRSVHQIEQKRDTTKLYKCNLCLKVYRKYGAFEKHLGMHITL